MTKYDELALDEIGDKLSERNLPKDGERVDLVQRLLDDDTQKDIVMADAEVNAVPNPPSSEPDVQSPTASETSNAPSPQQSPMSTKYQLRKCLSGVIYAGSFATSRTSNKVVDPGIHIPGVGNISLPLRVPDAHAILSIGSQAPFGRGSATIIDTTFRNTKELSPDQFELQNPAWTDELTSVVGRLVKDLGFADGASGVKAELYKMLLYEDGAMFKPHKDSEKVDGMFGTLVICLPSMHCGGELVLSHKGETLHFNTAKASRFGQTHLAWYSDVIHEIKPVTSGYRLVLTYNLTRLGYHGPRSAECLTDEKLGVQTILAKWNSQYEAGQPTSKKLLYVLDHMYSTANLKFSSLKGRDALLGRLLKEACEKEKVDLLLATMRKTTTNIREDDDDLYEPDERIGLSGLVALNGDVVSKLATLLEDEVIQDSPWERSPDEEDREETGNEGIDITHYYRDTVMVLLPREAALDFRMENMEGSAISSWINDLIGTSQKHPDDPRKRESLLSFCKRAIEVGNKHYKVGERCWIRQPILAMVIEACGLLRDVQLLHKAVDVCAGKVCISDVHQAVARTFLHLPFADVKPCLDNLVGYAYSFHRDMEMLDNLRPVQLLGDTENNHTELNDQYHELKIAAMKEYLRELKKITTEDVSAVLRVLAEQGIEMAIEHVLPCLERFVDQTSWFVAILTCMIHSKEGKRVFVTNSQRYPDLPKEGRVPQEIAELVLDKLIPLVIPALSLGDYHQKQSEAEPFWDSYKFLKLPEDDHLIFAKQTAEFYCYCLKNKREEDADKVLAWLRNEVDTAHVRIFPAFVLAFLPALHNSLKSRGIQVVTAHQTTAQQMFAACIRRCIGPAPTKPTDWVRTEMGCGWLRCKLCQSMNKFFADPFKETANFSAEMDYDREYESSPTEHIYRQGDNRDSRNNKSKFERVKNEKGETIIRITKTDIVYQKDYREWKGRFKGVGYMSGPLWESGKLLGDMDEEELQRLIEKQASSQS